MASADLIEQDPNAVQLCADRHGRVYVESERAAWRPPEMRSVSG
jgi:hypothetical protein